MEASVARNAASIAYHDYLRDQQKRQRRHHSSTNETMSILREAAIQRARQAEMEAFDMVNLSVQELIDCDVDTGGDQGCIGGNPLLAFYYIHQYGLTTWDEYKYLGRAAGIDKNSDDGSSSGFKCRSDLVANPIATVSSWGVIPRNREDLIELALRYIGPVAVGINGDDPSFMAYSGGIFNKPTCGHGRSNHAMLIVGYGEETVEVSRVAGSQNETNPATEVVQFWIARNSWGQDWGEKGYMRIQRGEKKRGPGVCGIAANPSVALDGSILHDRQPPKRSHPNNWLHGDSSGSSSPESHSEREAVSSFCDNIWEGPWKVGCNRATQ